MRMLLGIALSLLLVTTLATAQQSGPVAPSTQGDSKAERVTVYAVGPDVKAPEFILTNLPPIAAEKCKKKIDGKVELSLFVDATGRTRNLMFLHPPGNDLDKLALKIVASDRFNPATRDKVPVVVAESVEVSMQACLGEAKDNAGKKTYLLRLRSQPVRKYETKSPPYEEVVLTSGDGSWNETASGAVPKFQPGKGITPPALLNNPQAEFTEEARRAGFTGSCALTMIVDAQGMPQDVQIVQPLRYGLDQEAVEVAKRYRFKPAVKDGEPVPVKITLEANFRNY